VEEVEAADDDTVERALFEWDGHRWQGRPCFTCKGSHDAEAADRGGVKVICWNVYTDGYHRTSSDDFRKTSWLPRQRALIKSAKAADADVLCFQGVSAPVQGKAGRDSFLELLLRESWVRKGYCVSGDHCVSGTCDTTGPAYSSWYRTVILSRVSVGKLVAVGTPSTRSSYAVASSYEERQASKVLAAHLQVGGQEVMLAVSTLQGDGPVEWVPRCIQYYEDAGAAAGVSASLAAGVFISDCSIRGVTTESETRWCEAGWGGVHIEQNEGAGSGLCRLSSSMLAEKHACKRAPIVRLGNTKTRKAYLELDVRLGMPKQPGGA